MTVAELITKIRIRVNDTDSLEFSDDEILGYINEALKYIENILSENNSSIISTTLDLDTSATVFPADVLRIIKILNSNKKELTRVYDTDEVKENEFTVFNNEIIIGDVPCKLYYMQTLERYDSTADEVNVFVPLIEYIIDYVIIKCLSRLDYNLTIEEQKLQILQQNIITMIRHRDGFPLIKRKNDYYL